MRATIANMKALLREYDEPTAVPGVMSYSFETGEEFSASPGDYFWMNDRDCLVDSEGNDMVLVREIRSIEVVELTENV